MAKSFLGKQALITGASAGIGEEFARQLHRAGASVVLVARRKDRLESIAAELNAVRADSASVFVADLERRQGHESLQVLIEYIAERPFDILVNNAGCGSFGRYEKLDLAAEERMVALNITAPLCLTHAAIPAMKARGSGTIITVSSIAAFQPLPYMATYAATKAFDLSFGLALREELAPFGVQSVVLCPGPTATEFAGVARVPGEWTGIFRDSVESVVGSALSVALRGKALAVPGIRAQAMALLSRLTPLSLSTNIVRKALSGALCAVESRG